jgi:hypothetical protein
LFLIIPERIFATYLKQIEMIIENEKESELQGCLPNADYAINKENDEEIENLTSRKDVLNNVLEKLIDKINQPPTTVKAGKL